jgi:hypothetical protein
MNGRKADALTYKSSGSETASLKLTRNIPSPPRFRGGEGEGEGECYVGPSPPSPTSGRG